MKKSRFSEQQIAYTLRQAESGVSIQEITRKMELLDCMKAEILSPFWLATSLAPK